MTVDMDDARIYVGVQGTGEIFKFVSRGFRLTATTYENTVQCTISLEDYGDVLEQIMKISGKNLLAVIIKNQELETRHVAVNMVLKQYTLEQDHLAGAMMANVEFGGSNGHF